MKMTNDLDWITCSMCGTRFDPNEHAGCPSCPLQSNCQLACCPNCGYQMILAERSVLARLARRFLPKVEAAHKESASVPDRSVER
jgi:DNA-directed RNA polymerase subunit RPC12/RpoP